MQDYKLNWPEIVKEAIRRRNEEGLMQKTHAALAGVSIPTMISFERAATTISMDKVLTILEVVGMIIKEKPIDKLSEFADQANKRWFELSKKLPINSNGYFACFFAIRGKLKNELIIGLESQLKSLTNYSDFPRIREIESSLDHHEKYAIKRWLGKQYLYDTSSNGYMYIQKGYQEDLSDILEPGKIFDLISPICSIGEIIYDTHRLASSIGMSENASIDFRVKYTGLKGRELVNWSNPTNPLFERNKICLQNTVESSIQFQLNDIDEPLPEQIGKLVNLLLKDLYFKFGFYELKYEFIVHHLGKLFEKFCKNKVQGN